MSVNGEADGPPLRLGIPMVDLATGMQATIAVLAALVERARSGRGHLCDLALHECALSVAHPHLANYLWTGKTPARSGNGHPNIAPYDAFETATVPVYVAVGNERQFATLCAELGDPGLAQDPRFLRNVDRIANRAELRAALAPAGRPGWPRAVRIPGRRRRAGRAHPGRGRGHRNAARRAPAHGARPGRLPRPRLSRQAEPHAGIAADAAAAARGT